MSKKPSIVIIVLKEKDDAPMYSLEFLEESDNILPITIHKKKEKKLLNKKEEKILKKIFEQKPKLVTLVQENKNTKKISIETSSNLKKQIISNQKITKNGKITDNQIIEIIRKFGNSYCILEIPSSMELVDKIMLEKKIMENIIKYLFSNSYI
jgi:DNA-directed RNA polymerase beta' subunit